MKRLLLICLLVLVFTIPSSLFAFDLGKGITLDGTVSLGKLWDVDLANTKTTRTLSISERRGEIYFEGEAGLRYKFFRAFGKYQYLGGIGCDEVFSLEGTGIDIYPSEKIPAWFRVSYNWLKVPGLIDGKSLKHDFAYTGVMFKF